MAKVRYRALASIHVGTPDNAHVIQGNNVIDLDDPRFGFDERDRRRLIDNKHVEVTDRPLTEDPTQPADVLMTRAGVPTPVILPSVVEAPVEPKAVVTKEKGDDKSGPAADIAGASGRAGAAKA